MGKQSRSRLAASWVYNVTQEYRKKEEDKHSFKPNSSFFLQQTGFVFVFVISKMSPSHGTQMLTSLM